MRAIAKQLSRSDAMFEQQLWHMPVSVEPAYCYTQAKFEDDLKPTRLAFQAAQYFTPLKVHDIKTVAADLETLRAFPFLNLTQVMDGLKSKLPKYEAAFEDLSKQVNFIQ